MKHSFSKILLFFLLAATPLFAQSDCANTPNTGAPLSLALPVAHCQLWNVQLNANFSAINAFAGGVVLLNPLVSQTVNQPLGTALMVNSLQLYGTAPTVQFGTSAGAPTGYLTEVSSANFTLDGSSPGDATAAISLSVANAVNGFRYNNGAGVTAGNCLIAGSDSFHTFAPGNCINPTSVSYQTVASNGTAETQRPTLNFSSRFVLSDSPSPAQTSVDLANVGTAGTYANPASVTVNQYGQVTAVTAGGGAAPVPRTCNSNGCYQVDFDGTIRQWGISPTIPSSGLNTLPITFPIAFSSGAISAHQVSVTSSFSVRCTTGSDSGCGAYNTLLTTTGFTLSTETNTGSGTNFAYWYAVGY